MLHYQTLKKRRFHMLLKSVLMMFANNSESILYLDLVILSNKGRCSERLSMPIYDNRNLNII